MLLAYRPRTVPPPPSYVLAVVGKDKLVGGVTTGQAAATCREGCLLAKDAVQGLASGTLQRNGVVDFGGDGQALQSGNIVVQDAAGALPHIALEGGVVEV